MYPETSILTVNYNTPELLRELLNSIDKFCPNINVYVVDGSDNKNLVKQTKMITKDRKNTVLFSLGRNIHHGPGLDFGIRKIDTKYILLMDTDSVIIKAGLIERMHDSLDGGYGIGKIEYVDRNGWNVPEGNGIPYLHPRCALIDKDQYLKYKPALKHGAPMINAMTDIFDKGDQMELRDFPNLDEYYVHLGRGTVNITGGYHLENKKKSFKQGLKGLIKKIISFK